MTKKHLLILAAVAAGCFGVSTFLSISMAPKSRPTTQQADVNAAPATPEVITAGLVGGEAKLTPKESQLDGLIREVREKIRECCQKEQSLQEREGRLELAQELLKKQTADLENLRISLLAPLNTIKEEQDKLEKSRVRIAAEEKVNIKKTAAIYEKMDSASAAKILAGMCESQQEDQAVEILHFMSDRAAAKVLGELTDKGAAGRLTEKLKNIHEEG